MSPRSLLKYQSCVSFSQVPRTPAFPERFEYIHWRFPYLLCHVLPKSGMDHVQQPLESCQSSDVLISWSLFWHKSIFSFSLTKYISCIPLSLHQSRVRNSQSFTKVRSGIPSPGSPWSEGQEISPAGVNVVMTFPAGLQLPVPAASCREGKGVERSAASPKVGKASCCRS